jgi:hypothetical protein
MGDAPELNFDDDEEVATKRRDLERLAYGRADSPREERIAIAARQALAKLLDVRPTVDSAEQETPAAPVEGSSDPPLVARGRELRERVNPPGRDLFYLRAGVDRQEGRDSVGLLLDDGKPAFVRRWSRWNHDMREHAGFPAARHFHACIRRQRLRPLGGRRGVHHHCGLNPGQVGCRRNAAHRFSRRSIVDLDD